MFHRRTLALAVLAAAAALAGCSTMSMSKPVSVADTIAAQPELSTLNGLVAKAGLADMLKGPGPYTVFAPTNAAFAKVPAKTMDALAKDPALLKATLAYHVVPAKLTTADIKMGNQKTANGANIALSKAGTFVTVEDAMVQTPDIVATNGVVQVIDAVLIPPAK